MTLLELERHSQIITQCTDVHTTHAEQIRKTTIAQQMSEQAYDSTKVNTKQSIPLEY
jgi:hypothetical protein